MNNNEITTPLDFSKERVQTISLPLLEATYKENDVYGRPLGGIYHCDLINSIAAMAHEAGFDTDMEDMFAVNNLDGKRPGVALLPEVEQTYGERSVKAHLLRRVFAVIRLSHPRLPQGAEFCPAIAVSYSQHGIQIAVGPNVHICRNMTILSARQIIANYGYARPDMDKRELAGGGWWKPTVGAWIDDAARGAMTEQWQERIDCLASEELNITDVHEIFGALMQRRIECDTPIRSIRTGAIPPLTQTQINFSMERLLARHFARGSERTCTKWDVLNAMTDTLKPLCSSSSERVPACDTSRLLPQLAECAEFLYSSF